MDTPLHSGQCGGHVRHSAYTYCHQEQMSTQDLMMDTQPYIWLPGCRGHPAVAVLLCEAGAHVTAQDNLGDTPVHDAAMAGTSVGDEGAGGEVWGEACLTVTDTHNLTPFFLSLSTTEVYELIILHINMIRE